MSTTKPNYELEIMPNGKLRNLYPDYVVFNDHIKEGLHQCSTCKCSFCHEPSFVTIPKALHKTDGHSRGLMYCIDCYMIKYNVSKKGPSNLE